jgi:hypothetical protein
MVWQYKDGITDEPSCRDDARTPKGKPLSTIDPVTNKSQLADSLVGDDRPISRAR